MYPAVATGAHNPAQGMVAAVLSTALLDTAPPNTPFTTPPPLAPAYGAAALAEQILAAVARCRALGHREPRVTLTRPSDVVEGVRGLLERAGLQPLVRASSIPGQSVLTLRL